MSIKRSIFALFAMMLLPAVAFAQPTPPALTPATGTAVIAVLNIFTDGNTEDTVNVSISCNAGTISPDTAELSHNEGVSFVLSNLPDPIPNNPFTCTVSQAGVSDYSDDYLCAKAGSELAGATGCGNPDFDVNVATSCFFGDVRPYLGDGVSDYNVGYCAMYSSPEPVDVDVTKVWETFGAEQGEIDQDVDLKLTCNPALGIVGGTNPYGSKWTKTITLSDSDYLDEDDEYVGEGTAEFEVIPSWFPTSTDPKDQLYTECWVEEDASDNSAVEVDNGCGDDSDSAAIKVAAGMGDECTITNTVFFEGIPTLSQYGMALMALLMLGVGFVGMRRFV